MNAPIALGDVQRIVVHDYDRDRAHHFVLTVREPRIALGFIASLAPQIADAVGEDRERVAMCLAFTYPGLRALGLPAEVLATFRMLAPAFCAGAAARASRYLRDTGRNDAGLWDAPFRSADAHVLLSIYADAEADLRSYVAILTNGADLAGGLSGWSHPLRAQHVRPRGDRREHFGFRDGVSQPLIRGLHPGESVMHIAPGELLLGHADEDGKNAWKTDIAPQAASFAFDGSFLALRKMEQDVDAFERFRAARGALAAAKACGRWPNGALVLPGQTEEPADGGSTDNAFDFSRDPDGLGCPFGSHIRRLNPRGDRVIPPRRRLLMRRGMPYRDDAPDGSSARGLLGMFICASLERQFEFLLGEWAVRPPRHPYREQPAADPFMGDQHDPAAAFHIPGAEPIVGLPSFVTTRGTLYAFFPSRRALRMMGTMS
jgi:deferrochelatase/peroxidase EfeB